MNDFNFWSDGASITAVIAFFATWIVAIALFNFLGLALGWIPALIVAVVLYFTAPFLYALLGIMWLILMVVLFMYGVSFLV